MVAGEIGTVTSGALNGKEAQEQGEQLTIYLAYATTGREFEVEHNVQAEGFQCWCAKELAFIRRGTSRYPEPVTRPRLPNYLFLTLSADQWHAIRSRPVKHLDSTWRALRRDDEQELARFRAASEADYARAMRISEANDPKMWEEYEAGQPLIDLQGRFAEDALRFRKVITKARKLGKDWPEQRVIVAEAEMMGRTVTVELDPLSVKAKSRFSVD